MEEVEVIATMPERICTTHNFGISPFGVYCLDCCVPISDVDNDNPLENPLRMHIHRQKHTIADSISVASIAKSLEQSISDRFGHMQDFTPWIKKRNIITFKCTCGETSKKRWNIKRHIKNVEENNQKAIHQLKVTRSVLTVCGRIIEEAKIENMMQIPDKNAQSLPVMETNIDDTNK